MLHPPIFILRGTLPRHAPKTRPPDAIFAKRESLIRYMITHASASRISRSPDPHKAIGCPFTVCVHAKFCEVVWKMENQSSSRNSRWVIGVETEEIDTRDSVMAYISTNVALEKCGCQWNRWKAAQAKVSNAKWNHADPRMAVEEVEIELRWNQRLYGRDLH